MKGDYPNIITLLRMAGSFGLLLCDVTGAAFWIIYALCGISDIVDGWLARKLNCVTRTGALLDSLADICFVACCACLSKQGNGIPAIHCSPHDICVHHPHFNRSSNCHVCSHSGGMFPDILRNSNNFISLQTGFKEREK